MKVRASCRFKPAVNGESVLAVGRLLGYCTNVHAGVGYAQTRENLQRYACAVKRRFSPDHPMGLGLWLSSRAAREMIDGSLIEEFGRWLDSQGLVPITFNGFPYGDFHQKVVKHAVYHPVWGSPERTAYTMDLIHILDQLLPPGHCGTISTLPVAWDAGQGTGADAAKELLKVARSLARLQTETGREIVLCIEPEPGCLFQRSADVVAFFQQYLFNEQTVAEEDIRAARSHLQVCHDVCHAAVMFESQEQMFSSYRAAGIGIGKIQVSSAIAVRFTDLDHQGRQTAIDRLSAFAEDRYLHQTVCRNATTDTVTFFEDLPDALATVSERPLEQEEWRIHFHVPLFAKQLGGGLETTQAMARDCLALFGQHAPGNDGVGSALPHWEVETYAWAVLPADLAAKDLAEGIFREMDWAIRQSARQSL